ncbi:DUF2897 family protein [Shewanella xiamenensis]|uniref:DUF2897 family protein n=1 Tax=Shewanella xiamenensis TaxID=332186 RepID=UPI0035B6ADBC
MSSLEVWIIIILVVGVIASNIAALKYSAKFKLPQFGQHDKEKQLKSDMTQPPQEADGNETQTPDKSSNQSK